MTNKARSKAGARKSAKSATQAETTSTTEASTSTAASTTAVDTAARALVAAARTAPAGADEEATQRINEQDATERAALDTVQESAFNEGENSLAVRAADNGIGMIEVRGTGLRYVGLAPQRKKPGTVNKRAGIVLTGENTIFTPLSAVPYEAGFSVEDPKTGEFYATPPSGDMDRDPRRWLDVAHPETGTPLIGEATKEGRASRRKAAGLPEE